MNIAQQLRAQLGVDAPQKKDFQMQYGYNDTHIIVGFGMAVDNLTMTIEQIDAMMAALTEARAAFVEHTKK